MGSILNFN